MYFIKVPVTGFLLAWLDPSSADPVPKFWVAVANIFAVLRRNFPRGKGGR
jgi:hypothetical protein